MLCPFVDQIKKKFNTRYVAAGHNLNRKTNYNVP